MSRPQPRHDATASAEAGALSSKAPRAEPAWCATRFQLPHRVWWETTAPAPVAVADQRAGACSTPTRARPSETNGVLDQERRRRLRAATIATGATARARVARKIVMLRFSGLRGNGEVLAAFAAHNGEVTEG